MTSKIIILANPGTGYQMVNLNISLDRDHITSMPDKVGLSAFNK